MDSSPGDETDGKTVSAALLTPSALQRDVNKASASLQLESITLEHRAAAIQEVESQMKATSFNRDGAAVKGEACPARCRRDPEFSMRAKIISLEGLFSFRFGAERVGS